jgi:hypothetical protein
MSENEFDYNFLLTAILQYLPLKRKISTGKWLSYNCPYCMHNGQSRPDTRGRGGLKDHGGGSFQIHCFNCGFNCGWTPGYKVNDKIKKYMDVLGIPKDDIRKLLFKAWQINQTHKDLDRSNTQYVSPMTFNEIQWPEGAKSLQWWMSDPHTPPKFHKAFEYLVSRGSAVATSYEYFWTPKPYVGVKENFNDMSDRIIIPFWWNGKLVGFHARTYKNIPARYIGVTPPGYMFGLEHLDSTRDFILVVEGVFDAISLNCLASLGSTLNSDQIRWLSSSGKKIIILADHDKAGQKLIDCAVNANWSVSFPWSEWDPDIKDAAEAVKRYGKIWTLQTIFNTMTNNKLEIELKRRMI